MGKANEIVDGFTTLFLDKLGKATKDQQNLAEFRRSLCMGCELKVNNFCDPRKKIQHVRTKQMVGGCGCNLAAKVFSKQSKCPAGRW